jgi:hypothetical protein
MDNSTSILRCASNITSAIPSRIVNADLSLFHRRGIVALHFSYDNITYDFNVPFTRPYLNQAEGKFANLLNLNQARSRNNQEFQNIIERITDNYTANPVIEIPCQIQLVGNEEVR